MKRSVLLSDVMTDEHASAHDPVAAAIIQSTEHLRIIRSYLGWLLFLAMAGVVAGIFAVIQAAQDSSNGF